MKKLISSAILLSSVIGFAAPAVAPAPATAASAAAPAVASPGTLLCPTSVLRADMSTATDADTQSLRIALPTATGPMTEANFVAGTYTMSIDVNPSVIEGKLYGAMVVFQPTGSTNPMKRIYNQFLFLRDDASSPYNSHLGFSMIESSTDPITMETLITREAFAAINQVIPGLNAKLPATAGPGQKLNLLTSLKVDEYFMQNYQPALQAAIAQNLLQKTDVIGVSMGYAGCDFAP